MSERWHNSMCHGIEPSEIFEEVKHLPLILSTLTVNRTTFSKSVKTVASMTKIMAKNNQISFYFDGDVNLFNRNTYPQNTQLNLESSLFNGSFSPDQFTKNVFSMYTICNQT